jgi:Arsenical resistance operon protein ArsD
MNATDVTKDLEPLTAIQIALFDPPLCCPTGLCGPTLDQTLLDVNELVRALQAEGISVERYQIAAAPHIFLKHAEVMRLVREQGMEALPITVVAGRVTKTGAYPTRREIDAALQGAMP